MKLQLLFYIFLIVGILSSCSKDDKTNSPESDLPTIAEIICSRPEFDSLQLALELSGLYNQLNQAGDYTLFAQNNTSYSTGIPSYYFRIDTYRSLKEIPFVLLRNGIQNNIIGSRVYTSDLTVNQYLTSLNKGLITNEQSMVHVNVSDEIKISQVIPLLESDILASNGVIHVIDRILGPRDLNALINDDPNLRSMENKISRNWDLVLKLIDVNGLTAPPLSVFVPSNLAFTNYRDSASNSFDNLDTLTQKSILKHHMISGLNLRSNQLINGSYLTENSDNLSIIENGLKVVSANGDTAAIIKSDIQSINGVIHVIDKVLTPR